jgi:hypothetical protein
MLTFWGGKHRFCDNISRRDFLRVGALGLGGLTLPDVLRLQAASKTGTSPRSVIMVCLAGGPSHLDMYDLKPGAPVEYRGQFKPIKTNVAGFNICEHMPLQARVADKLALVRTLQFVEPLQHELEEVYTGFPKSAKRPAFGSIVSRYRGGDRTAPPYVSLEYSQGTSGYENPQYAGAAHRPLHIAGGAGVRNLGLLNGISRARLEDRRGLLQSFDTIRRDLDTHRESQDMAPTPPGPSTSSPQPGPGTPSTSAGSRTGSATGTAARTTSSFTSARRRILSGTATISCSRADWSKRACAS